MHILNFPQASLGAARLLVRLMQARGIAEAQARACIWLIDRRGLITTARKDLTPEKAEFAQVGALCRRLCCAYFCFGARFERLVTVAQ